MKKVLLVIGGLSLLYFGYTKMKKPGTDDAALPATTPKQALINKLMQLHAAEFATRGLGPEIYDQFNEAELQQIYDQNNGGPTTPEYVAMLKLHGWA